MKSPALLTAWLIILTGCRILQPVKDISAYHVLEPLVPDRPLSAVTPAIAVNRPTLPNYLDRSELATQTNGQLQMSPADLWAEPLGSAISRVTASNLSRLTGSLNIQPVENFTTLDYTSLLELKIARFEPSPANQVILAGTWKLQPVSGTATDNHYFRIEAPIPNNSSGMASRVQAMNKALEILARQIINAADP